MSFPATKRTICSSSHCRFVFILSFYGASVVLCLVFQQEPEETLTICYQTRGFKCSA